MDKNDFRWAIGTFVLAIVITFTFESRGIFVSERKAIKELDVQGYSEIKIIDHDWFFVNLRGGASDDAARFEAEAINPAGKKVNVNVYCGWPLKGATIRSK